MIKTERLQSVGPGLEFFERRTFKRHDEAENEHGVLGVKRKMTKAFKLIAGQIARHLMPRIDGGGEIAFFDELALVAPIGLQKRNFTFSLFVERLGTFHFPALGQIAMSTYYATQKEKEIGIRKVFGGTVRSESIRNIFEYMVYCLIATVIAVPVSVWSAGRYLETFVYRMDLPAWIFVTASLSAFAISLASVLWQTIRAARTNPAEALKKE